MNDQFFESSMHQPVFLEIVTDEYLDQLSEDQPKNVHNSLATAIARHIMKKYVDYEDNGGDPLVHCGFGTTDYDYDVSDVIDEILNEN